MKPARTCIQIKRLAVACRIGVPQHERKHAQTVIIDIECELADPHIAADAMAASLDYSEIVERVRTLSAARVFILLETLAEAIARAVLKDTRIQHVLVRCHKPFKFSGCAAVGVERCFCQ